MMNEYATDASPQPPTSCDMELFALRIRNVAPTTGKMSDVSAPFAPHLGLFDPQAAKKLYS
jgi:hypothetical protein